MFAVAGSSTLFNTAFAQDVIEGLNRIPQKTLPASWLYDEVGSALFEVITVLPEYGLTRADGSLLRRAASEIVEQAGGPEFVIELGSGTGTKTKHLLAAAGRVKYLPIDISRIALENCVAAMQSLEDVRVDPIEATYLEGIDIALSRRPTGQRALILFLGSTIGNFTRTEAADFLKRVRLRVNRGDSLLVGADLEKPVDTLIRAYNDSLGVTAAFNLNLLARINRELDADFDLRQFAHEARYDARQARIEMHLRSRIAQQVRIGAIDLTVDFAQGETIWTESSHKFRAEHIRALGREAGWQISGQWLDREWGFAETLFTAA